MWQHGIDMHDSWKDSTGLTGSQQWATLDHSPEPSGLYRVAVVGIVRRVKW